jgi:hypothetical protein
MKLVGTLSLCPPYGTVPAEVAVAPYGREQPLLRRPVCAARRYRTAISPVALPEKIQA